MIEFRVSGELCGLGCVAAYFAGIKQQPTEGVVAQSGELLLRASQGAGRQQAAGKNQGGLSTPQDNFPNQQALPGSNL